MYILSLYINKICYSLRYGAWDLMIRFNKNTNDKRKVSTSRLSESELGGGK